MQAWDVQVQRLKLVFSIAESTQFTLKHNNPGAAPVSLLREGKAKCLATGALLRVGGIRQFFSRLHPPPPEKNRNDVGV